MELMTIQTFCVCKSPAAPAAASLAVWAIDVLVSRVRSAVAFE